MPSIRERIWKLPLPTPYPVGDVNVYFIDGPEPVLIDTGVYSSKSLDALRGHLAARGRKLEDIRRILITHEHYDHAGAALWLSETVGATLYLSEKSTLLSRWQAETMDKLFAFLLRCGVPREQMEQAFQAFSAGAHFGKLDSKPHAVEWLKGGETIAVDGVSLEVIPTPGHAPDHLAFFEPASRALFCGDLILPHITPNPSLYLDARDGYRRIKSLLAYLESLDRIAARDVAVAHPGHSVDIADVRALIAKNRGFIDDRKQCFAVQVSMGPINPYDLARGAFGKLDLINQYLAVSETVAYLDLLEREGEIAVDWDADEILARPLASGIFSG
jgi:glyoxylase-like metal-dependent hydrolase (beta-lactamase superfamily II)